ncbi:hypothetical protein AB6A40_004112 [Gnathostoma spinigerum]|uniref:Uncharacterized protein n=1 Tax=Gnathostoma spinigerum TaxID=75299 RepID=A0ABD6EBP4_9BILA
MKGLRNCFLPIEYMGLLALIAMHKDDVEFQRKMRYLLDKEFTQRRRLLLTPEATAKAAYLLPEYCIPYAVYILSKQPMLSSHNDVATLMTFKECLWFLLEIFHSRKEIRGCEFICSMLQVMKNSRDATMEECAPKERDEQNKKMWALCDLGILLLSYRMVIAARGQQQRVNLSKRFILRSQSNKPNVQIYLPEVIIEQEKKKVHHGRKVPDSSHSRSAAFGSSKASTSKLLESHSEISAKIFTDGSDSVKQSLRRSLPTRSAKVTRKCELRSADISRQSRKSVRSHQKTTKINNATSYGLEDEASSPSPSKSPGRKQIEHDSSPMSSTSSQNRKVASDGTHSAKTSRRSAFSLRTSFSDFSPILPNDFAAKGKAAVTKPSRGALVSSTPLVSSKTRKNSNSVTDVLLRRSVLRSYTERRSQVKGESHKNVESLTDNGRKRKRKSSKDQFSDAAAEEVTKGQEEELTSDEVKTHHSPLRHKPSTKKRLSSQKKMSLKEKHLPDGAKKTAVSRLSSRSKVQKPSALLGSKNVHLCPESIKESVDAKLINESNEFSASCIGINDVRKKSDGKRRDVQSGQEQGSVKDVSNNGFKARKGPISDLSPQRRSPRKVRQKLINGNAIRGKDSLKSGSKRQMSLRRRPRHR